MTTNTNTNPIVLRENWLNQLDLACNDRFIELVPDASMVERVYSGTDGKCCCGCSGTYWENDGSKKSTAAVKRVLNKLSIFPVRVECDPTYRSIVIEGRLYIAYLKD